MVYLPVGKTRNEKKLQLLRASFLFGIIYYAGLG